MVTDTWRLAYMDWEQRRDQVTYGYPEENRDYREEHPSPKLRDAMIALRIHA